MNDDERIQQVLKQLEPLLEEEILSDGEPLLIKPEFPKPRIIREDFMPEENVLKNYRVKRVEDVNGVRFLPQHKYFGLFWCNILDYKWGEYCYEHARDVILSHYYANKRNKVEYLEVKLENEE